MNSGNFHEVLAQLKQANEDEAKRQAEQAEKERIAREGIVYYDSGFLAEYAKETNRFNRKAERKAARKLARELGTS
jgi:hypothetical protein